MGKARKASKPDKRQRHDWVALRNRFVLQREWLTLAAMAEALATEHREKGGTKPPALSLIRKRAADETWHEERAAMEREAAQDARRQIVSREAAALVQVFEKEQKTGAVLLAMGGNWVRAKQEAADLANRTLAPGEQPKEGAITNAREALAFIRTGAVLERLSAIGLAKLAEPAKPAGAIGGPNDSSNGAGLVIDPADESQVFGRLARLLGQEDED